MIEFRPDISFRDRWLDRRGHDRLLFTRPTSGESGSVGSVRLIAIADFRLVNLELALERRRAAPRLSPNTDDYFVANLSWVRLGSSAGADACAPSTSSNFAISNQPEITWTS